MYIIPLKCHFLVSRLLVIEIYQKIEAIAKHKARANSEKNSEMFYTGNIKDKVITDLCSKISFKQLHSC